MPTVDAGLETSEEWGERVRSSRQPTVSIAEDIESVLDAIIRDARQT